MSPGRATLATSGASASGPSIGAHDAVAARLQAGDQRVAVDALDRRLAGGIDRRHRPVGIVEGGAELLHQVAQPGEAVRLDHGDDPALPPSRAAASTARISTGWWP